MVLYICEENQSCHHKVMEFMSRYKPHFINRKKERKLLYIIKRRSFRNVEYICRYIHVRYIYLYTYAYTENQSDLVGLWWYGFFLFFFGSSSVSFNNTYICKKNKYR